MGNKKLKISLMVLSLMVLGFGIFKTVHNPDIGLSKLLHGSKTIKAYNYQKLSANRQQTNLHRSIAGHKASSQSKVKANKSSQWISDSKIHNKKVSSVFSRREINRRERKLKEIALREDKKFKQHRSQKYYNLLKHPNLPNPDRFSLMGVNPVTSEPKFFERLNLSGAKTIKTAHIWTTVAWNPGSIPTYAINGGEGLNYLGVWDGGAVDGRHAELSGLITVGDSSNTDTHATHVGGTLVAKGRYTYIGDDGSVYISGMAHGALLASYDYANDISEFSQAAQINGLDHGVNGRDQLRLSNHSYGTVVGWRYDGSSSCDGDWYWFGNPSVNAYEDYKFGAYLADTVSADEALYSAPYLVQTWATGNARDEDGPRGSYCPASSWYEYNSSNIFISQTTDAPNPNDSEGGYDTLTPEATAKNVISIGAVEKEENYVNSNSVIMADFSSWGPTDDGRIKPDLVAPGVSIDSAYYYAGSSYAVASSGTSMAAPFIGGSAALLQSIYNRYNSEYPLASTIKALLINTAREAGPFNGPDYQFGFGLPDVDAAASIIYENSQSDQVFIIQDSISNGEEQEYLVSTTGEKVKATLVWTDPAGSNQGQALDSRTKRLVHDLDLALRDSSSSYHYPWKLDYNSPTSAAQRGVNDRDNVEKIEVDTIPGSGDVWRLKVSHNGTLSSSQAYSIVLSGLNKIESDSRISLYDQTAGEGLEIDSGNVSVNMGSIISNQTTVKTIRIYNVGTGILELENILNSNATNYSYAIDKENIPENDYATMAITFNPSGTLGTIQTILSFETNDSSNTSISLNIFGTSDSTPTPQLFVQHISPQNVITTLIDEQTVGVTNTRITAGQNETHKLRIKNTGTGDLDLSLFSSMSNPFSWTPPTSQVVSSGSTVEFMFYVSIGTAGRFTQNLSFLTNVSGKENMNFTLEARVFEGSNPEIEVRDNDGTVITDNQSSEVLLGSVLAGVRYTRDILIKNTGDVPIDFSSFNFSGANAANFVWSTTVSSLDVSQSATVSYSFGSLTEDNYSANVNFNWKERGSSSETTFNFPVRIQVTGQPDISMSYNGAEALNNYFIPLDMGEMNIGNLSSASNERTLTIQNSGSSRLDITNVTLPNPFEITRYPSSSIMPGESTDLVFKFGRFTPNTYSGHIEFNTNITNNSNIRVYIKAKLNGPKLNLNYQTTGIYRDTYNFYALNAGYGENLTISNINVPFGFILDTDGDRDLAPNAVSSFKVVLDTTYGTGFRSGTISFQTNDPDESTTSIVISGGNPNIGIVAESDLDKNANKKSTPVVACGEVDLDGGNTGGPKNQALAICLGLLIAFLLSRGTLTLRTLIK